MPFKKSQNDKPRNVSQNEPAYSICPSGEKFPLPAPEDYAMEFERIQKIVEKQQSLNREIVVVMGDRLGSIGKV